MAVMVTLTLNTDAETYRKGHAGLIGAAGAAGLLFHSGREVPGGIAGTAAEGLQALGIPPPGDVEIVPVLTADSG